MCINAHVVSEYHDELRVKARDLINQLGEEGYGILQVQEIINDMAEMTDEGSY